MGQPLRRDTELPRPGQGRPRRRAVPLAVRARCSTEVASPTVTSRCSSSARRGRRTSRSATAPSSAAPAPGCSTSLNHLGINRSYLFLNSFVYPIFGQYTAKLRGLAQDPDSPIVQHRQRHLRRGAGPQRPPARDRGRHGGQGERRHVDHVAGRDVPGGRGRRQPLHAGRRARDRARRRSACSIPAAPRPAGRRPSSPTSRRKLGRIERLGGRRPVVAAAPIRAPSACRRRPTSTRATRSRSATCLSAHAGASGSGATSSNRKDGQRSIQLFSDGGHYNGQGDAIQYTIDGAGHQRRLRRRAGRPALRAAARPSRRARPRPVGVTGPAAAGRQAPGCAWPDFQALGVRAHPSLGWGPIHRGRYGGISLLVLADQESSDDLFTGRAMTGDAGQRFQSWLRAAGLTTQVRHRAGAARRHRRPAGGHRQRHRRPPPGRQGVRRHRRRASPPPAPTSGRSWRSARTPPAWPATSTAAGAPLVTMKAWRQTGALADWQRALTDAGRAGLPSRRRLRSPPTTAAAARSPGPTSRTARCGGRAARATGPCGPWPTGTRRPTTTRCSCRRGRRP